MNGIQSPSNSFTTEGVREKSSKRTFFNLTFYEIITIIITIAIPIAIGLYTALTTYEQDRIARERGELDLKLAAEVRQQQIYDQFINDIYTLHKDGELNGSASPWAFANARYRVADLQWDVKRKSLALQFMKEKQLIGRNKYQSGCEPKYQEDIIRLNESNFDYVNLASQTDKLNQLDMKYVRFERVSLSYGTFTNVNFNGASFDGSRLNGAKFSGCSFIAATFYGTELNDVDFGDSNLEGAQCINVHLSTLKFILAPPLRASSIDIPPNAKWKQNGITVAGGNGNGSGSNQLYFPQGLYVDDDQTIYIADRTNHRIMEWKCGAKSGRVVVGGNGQGNGTNQLNETYDVIVDRERDSLIICDYKNRRVVRWPRRDGGGTSGETIISNITCWGLRMDENGFLYVVDTGKHEVRRYNMSESEGKVVAGGNRSENGHDKLSSPHYVFVDRDHSVYVSDLGNHRVMKWEENATKGIVVAGGNGIGNESNLTQLHFPQGVVVDQLGTVYVADTNSQRIMRWAKGSSEGSVIAGGNGWGEQSNQLKFPHGLSFDRHGNLYVADHANHRVQKFEIEQTRNE